MSTTTKPERSDYQRKLDRFSNMSDIGIRITICELEHKFEKLEKEVSHLCTFQTLVWMAVIIWFGHHYAKEHPEPPKQAEVAK